MAGPPEADRARVFRYDLPPTAAAVYLELTDLPQPASAIAGRLGVHRSTAGRCLERLVDHGLADYLPEGWVIGDADPFSVHTPAATARAARRRAEHVEHHAERAAERAQITEGNDHGREAGAVALGAAGADDDGDEDDDVIDDAVVIVHTKRSQLSPQAGWLLDAVEDDHDGEPVDQAALAEIVEQRDLADDPDELVDELVGAGWLQERAGRYQLGDGNRIGRRASSSLRDLFP